MQHLVGNLYHVLVRSTFLSQLHFASWRLQADTLDKNFEKPLRQHLEAYRATVQVGYTRFRGRVTRR
jgi:hypothetical protein